MSAIENFVAKLAVMKPNKATKNNIKDTVKLDGLLDSNDYALEEKIDGCHYMMVACRFFSQEKIEKTDNYAHLRDFFVGLGMPNLILDGEINYPGKTSQYATHVTGASAPEALKFQGINGYIHYTIYDMLRTPKGTWITNYTYVERRKMLQYFYDSCVKGTPMEQYIHLTTMTVDNKRDLLDSIFNKDGEGGVLKKLDSLYLMGKKPKWQWMKIKKSDETDLIIMGFEEPTKEYTGANCESWPFWVTEHGVSIPVSKNYYNGWIGAVQLGAYVNGKLTKICTASGMDDNMRRSMSIKPEEYLNKVVKVDYMELTEAGYPRHPTIECLHEGKLPEDCTWTFEKAIEI